MFYTFPQPQPRQHRSAVCLSILDLLRPEGLASPRRRRHSAIPASLPLVEATGPNHLGRAGNNPDSRASGNADPADDHGAGSIRCPASITAGSIIHPTILMRDSRG